MFNWNTYTKSTKNKAPRQLLIKALGYLANKDSALDLGAGALNDSKYLIDFGFNKVVALDNELGSDFSHQNFTFVKTKIEDYNYQPESFDLVNAQFVLSFISSENINLVLEKVYTTLRFGGIFVGQLFGSKDSWATNLNTYVYSEEESRHLLSNFSLIYFEEEEKDGQTALGTQKHWHLFNFIVKKV